MKFDILSSTLQETEAFMAELSEKPFRAKQVYQWAHKGLAADFDDMTNLPKELREKLKNTAFLGVSSIANQKNSADGTIKFLNELTNHTIIGGERVFVESVLMKYRHGTALCISTQAGCGMGCAFCASGKTGLLRNLTAGEMISQVHAAAKGGGEKISNLTLMGMGEPLDNYDNTLRFLRLASDERSLGLSARRITLSTIGLTDKILDLADKKLQITLAVSLHGPNDRVRGEFVPVARAYPMEGLLEACKYYGDRTKRRVTFEYALVMGKNDRTDQAVELSGKLRNMLCHVNLIPMNPIKSGKKTNTSRGYRPSGEASVSSFRDTLIKNGIETTVRRPLGSSINAACGQLAGLVASCGSCSPMQPGPVASCGSCSPMQPGPVAMHPSQSE